MTMENSEMRIVARHMAQAPVNIQAILADLGIEYEEIPLDEASGSITRRGETFTVTVNSLESPNRKRFTAAHELAHYLFHRDLMGDGLKMHRHVDKLFNGSKQSDDGIFNRDHEVQANRIAAQIIMPKPLVEEKFAEIKDLAKLAETFRVSKSAMEIRCKGLGLIP